jgi:hypothetical protein
MENQTTPEMRITRMNIYLVTFDFSGEYGEGRCLVAARNEKDAKTLAQNFSYAKWYPIETVTLLDPAQYPAGGFIQDIVFIG